MLYAFYPSWMTLFIFVRWLQWNMGKNGLILSICSISIHNNGAEGSLSVSIEEMKELREFYLQNLMFVIIVLCDLGLLLSTRTQEILKNRPVKIWWGEIFTGWSRIFFPLSIMCHWLLCLTSPARQPVVVHSLDGRPRRPCSSNFRLHVNCARKTIASRNSRSSQVLLFLNQKLTC